MKNSKKIWEQMWAPEQQRVATSAVETALYPEFKERNLTLFDLETKAVNHLYWRFMGDAEALAFDLARLLARVSPSYGDIITLGYSESGGELTMSSQPPSVGVAFCPAPAH